MFSSNTTQVSGGYEIQRSLRFNSADSAYLNRTPASAGNRQTWTWSGWVKRSTLGAREGIFVCVDASGFNYSGLEFSDANQLVSYDSNAPSSTSVATNQVFRDVSAWYHIVYVVDTTQATASNRVKIYLNGAQITSFATADYPPQNSNTRINSANLHSIGSWQPSPLGLHFNGYMTEVNFIDGQALTPSSFGAFDAQTGVWGPTRYGGSYGTNGFYLNFSNNSNTTAATLGADYSGNGNNWTPNNFSVSAGAGNDSLVDVPTNWGVDTGVGGTVRGNYCTMNPVNAGTGGVVSLVNGNLDATTTAAAGIAYATFGASTGKWYWEVTPGAGSDWMIGIGREGGLFDFRTVNGFAYYSNGQKFTNNTGTSYGSSFGSANVIGVGLDMDAGTVTFYRDGVSQGTAFSGLSGIFFPSLQNPGAGTVGYIFNFGQRPFAYTAPSGFKALNTQNLPTPTIGATPATQAGKFFNPVLWTGTGSTRNVTGVGFQPDAVWVKSRSNVRNHELYDVVRGIGTTSYGLFPNLTDAEAAATASRVSAVNSDGFEITGGAGNLNQLDYTYVAWNWKANGAGVTNTAGTTTSTVSANTTSGFSIATFTGNGTAGATVGHGLGVAPRMVIVKSRGNARDWLVYHASVGATQFLQLNTTIAATTATTPWNDTAPTSSVFSLGTSLAGNESGVTRVAYCFAEVPGYSRFGSYVGNGSADGPFVFCGFRPAYVMIKCSSSSLPPGNADWRIYDSARNTSNVEDKILYANLSLAEDTIVSVDFLSNGFKLRQVNFSNVNAETYVFAAFASAPQKFSLAR